MSELNEPNAAYSGNLIFRELEDLVKGKPAAAFFVIKGSGQHKDQRYPINRGSVKDDPQFRRMAAENQWKARENRGLPKRMSICDFLWSVYEPWIGNGMNQADLLAVDRSAWYALQNFLRYGDLPFPLPKKHDTYLEAINDPVAQKEILKARELNRGRMRIINKLKRGK